MKGVSVGGVPETIAANQNGPTALTVSGTSLVWIDGLQGPPDAGSELGDGSAPSPTRVVTACTPK